jgi:hypothetical protein
MHEQLDLDRKPAGGSCSDSSQCCSGTCTSSGTCGSGAPCVTLYRNGYCTIPGCNFASTLKHAACPTGSHCNRGFWEGLCQKSCTLNAKTGCRGVTGDFFGDYDCRSWDRFRLSSGGAVSSGPVCDFGFVLPCSAFGSSTLTCDSVGDATNSTKMSCRDLSNSTLTNPKDPAGSCLDDTTSGPVNTAVRALSNSGAVCTGTCSSPDGATRGMCLGNCVPAGADPFASVNFCPVPDPVHQYAHCAGSWRNSSTGKSGTMCLWLCEDGRGTTTRTYGCPDSTSYTCKAILASAPKLKYCVPK